MGIVGEAARRMRGTSTATVALGTVVCAGIEDLGQGGHGPLVGDRGEVGVDVQRVEARA
jgi:hypothetical protein